MRSIEERLNLEYHISLRRDEGDYFAEVDELPGCIADGSSPNQAIKNLRQAMKSWMESRLAAGLQIPEPRSTSAYSGRILVRMPRDLHRKLAETAASESVSLNQYIVSALSETQGRREAAPSQAYTVQSSCWSNLALRYGHHYFNDFSMLRLNTKVVNVVQNNALCDLGFAPVNWQNAVGDQSPDEIEVRKTQTPGQPRLVA